MPNSILHKRSSTSGVVPHAALLANGEIALNSADGTWFIKKTDGTVLDLRQPLITDGGAALNPDAQDWAARVTTAGGTVSAATLQAVNNFCNAINAAGIRDRFYRLNLFCGNNLAACLVPLYRGPSLGGTQFGNATDTNVNFASGDYSERGATGGLLGSTASAKSLNTGLSPSALPTVATGHMAYYAPSVTTTSTIQRAIGAENAASTQIYSIGHRLIGGETYHQGTWGESNALNRRYPGTTATAAGFWLANRASATSLLLYRNGTQEGSLTTSTTPATITENFSVFAATVGTVVARHINHRLMMYSIGDSMTATQVAAYNTAMTAFQTALLRNVAPVVSNADAQDWVNRVYAAGGTVSQSTADAVNTFCNTINSTGLRDRFFRLNLFCGNDLTACLVPLYRGQSLGGTQFGNTTDTNNNFTASDYNERGTTGGLIGTGNNGIISGSKYLNTGLATSAWPAISSFHASAVVFGATTQSSATQAVPIAVRTNIAPLNRWGFDYRTEFNTINADAGGNTAVGGLAIGAAPNNQHILVTRRSVTDAQGFMNGFSGFTDGTDITSSLAPNNLPFFIFAQNQDGSLTRYFAFRMGGYSLGAGMTATQALVYNNAMQAFQTALNRAV